MIKCINYKEVNKGTFKGFVDIYIDKWELEIYGITLHEKNGSKWINLPSKEYIADGEKKYAPVIRFKERAHLNDFTKAVYKSIEEKCNKDSL